MREILIASAGIPRDYLNIFIFVYNLFYYNKINTSFINEVETIDDFREIRKISLEDKFFKDFHMDIGNSCKCPKCGGMIDMSHAAVNRGGVGSSPTRGGKRKFLRN